MQIELDKLVAILLCALVTWIPRVLPFVVVNKLRLPETIVRSLKFIPVCLFTSIVISMIVQPAPSDHFSFLIHWDLLFACVPTLLMAIRTQSLAKSVIVGVLSLYVIRLSL